MFWKVPLPSTKPRSIVYEVHNDSQTDVPAKIIAALETYYFSVSFHRPGLLQRDKQ